MVRISRIELSGFEYDWLATDRLGMVAFFSTAGGGYAPDSFIADVEAHDRAIAELVAHAPSTKAAFAPQIAPGLTNTWLQVAERGVFAFDSDPNGGPYRLVAAPVTPLQVEELPEKIASVAKTIVLPRVRFKDSKEGIDLIHQLG